jgi:hypothetical protein
MKGQVEKLLLYDYGSTVVITPVGTLVPLTGYVRIISSSHKQTSMTETASSQWQSWNKLPCREVVFAILSGCLRPLPSMEDKARANIVVVLPA